MISFKHSIGYKDTRENGDKNAPLLEEELDKFKDEIEAIGETFQFGWMSGFSCLTPHGLSVMKSRLAFRVLNDDRPMTILWFHPSEHSAMLSDYPSPKFQSDKKSPPVQGQRGGWYECPETKELKKIPTVYKWKFYGKIKKEDGEVVDLEKGEECSKANYNLKSCFSPRRGNVSKELNGRYVMPPHYEPVEDICNDYQGDVKSAILASPLDDKDKQELLDLMYQINDPVSDIDSYFCKKIIKYREDPSSYDINILSMEIESNNVISREIKDNLLVNLGLMKEEETSYYKKNK